MAGHYLHFSLSTEVETEEQRNWWKFVSTLDFVPPQAHYAAEFPDQRGDAYFELDDDAQRAYARTILAPYGLEFIGFPRVRGDSPFDVTGGVGSDEVPPRSRG